MSTKYDEMEKVFVGGEAADVASIRCPVCGSPLTVIFSEIGSRKALGIKCGNHCYRTNIDGLTRTPPWVAVLGHRFETR